ncbi:MAG TPA: hypothetical protein VFB42_05335 [Gaiellaceae bacterium]|nr:hypothetical protein [Gaiellaceae bacterium]
MVLAVAAALLAAASLRLPSLVSALLAAYLALVGEEGLVTLALSPVHAVRAGWLAAAEAVLAGAAAAAWWARGRPGLPAPAPAVRAAARDPLTLGALALLACVLGYELLLALTVPPNNWDSLTYHLARAAAWAQHGGIEWVANAPSDRLNEYQPLAEQENLFLFAATGTDALYAFPQYVAQLAALVAVYGAARRLGFGVRASAGSACVLATFSLVALEATTAQNDLVAASLVAAAACLALGPAGGEWALAGAAAGLGLGAKLTTALVWPALALLAAARGRRVAVRVAGAAAVAFAAVGMWGYVLDVAHTGHVLGYGVSRHQHTTGPSFPGSLRVGLHVLYRMLDLSSVSDALGVALAALGGAAGAAAGAAAFRGGGGARRAALAGAAVALPLAAPALVRGAGAAFSFAGDMNRSANEDYGAFGPLGAVLLLGAALWVPAAYVRGRADLRRLALALALPSFLVLLTLESEYNPFLTRFELVAAVLVAPLVALFFRGAAASAALLAAAGAVAFVTLRDDRTKPFEARPWRFTQAQALGWTWQPQVQQALGEYERLVPRDACVGAIVGGDEPSFVLWGRDLDRRVSYLPALDALPQAYRDGVFYVVVSVAADAPSADQFASVGWTVRPLGSYWLLAVAPHADAGCAA